MEKVFELVKEVLHNKNLISSTLSNVRTKKNEDFYKVTIRPILLKDKLFYQFEYHFKKKVAHENLDEAKAVEKINELFKEKFRQGQLYTAQGDYQVLISKKYKTKILKKPPTKTKAELSHNRKKQYIIPENIPNSFLIRLGVTNEKGKILSQKYDKFRQINRFLEMVEDIVPYLEDRETINIIDFGSGKSYLTFALYHYLKEIRKLKVKIIGLDLKKEVIDHCNEIAKDLEYEDLRFLTGNIEEYTGSDKIDMVVSLHACDTATDAALAKAIEWNAKIILSVPCCQHELLSQLNNEIMLPMERHGIIKERLSAMVTDAIRANILEIMGYSTQVIEFIDMEHTAKNLLIRAVNTETVRKGAAEEYTKFKNFWNVDPYLEKILGNKLNDQCE